MTVADKIKEIEKNYLEYKKIVYNEIVTAYTAEELLEGYTNLIIETQKYPDNFRRPENRARCNVFMNQMLKRLHIYDELKRGENKYEC